MKTVGLAVLFALLFVCSIPAQEQKSERLRKCLDELSASRSNLKTYTVKMRGIQSARNMKSATSKREEINFVLRTELEIACNLLEDRYVIIGQAEPAYPGLAQQPEKTEDGFHSLVYLVDGAVAKKLVGTKFVQLESLNSIPYPDPLSFGVGFCAETSVFVPFTQAISNLYLWSEDVFRLENRGALTTFRVPIITKPTQSSTHISFDRTRGGLIRSIGLRAGDDDSIEVLGEVEPIQVGGVWLPKRVAYCCRSSFYTWQLDWVSVNAPIPDDLFDEETLKALAGR